MKIGLFTDDYLFTGSHASKARSLTSLIDRKSQSRIFSSAVELFIVASLVGCIYNRTSLKEKSTETYRIMTAQLNNHRYELMSVYKTVLLCADSNNLNSIERINRAFRENTNSDNLDLFISYMLGGIDELYSVFFESNSVRYGDYLNCLKSFLKENSMYEENEEDNEEDIFGIDVF